MTTPSPSDPTAPVSAAAGPGDALTAAERRAEEAFMVATNDLIRQLGDASLENDSLRAALAAAERRAEEAAKHGDLYEKLYGKLVGEVVALAEVMSTEFADATVAGEDAVPAAIRVLRSERAAREKAEARLRETELWHRAAVRERDLMREQMDEILRYEDIETPGPDENVASVVLAALEHLREARERAERERDEWQANAILHGGNCEREALAHNTTRSRLSRAVEALREEAAWLTDMAERTQHLVMPSSCGERAERVRAVLAEVGK